MSETVKRPRQDPPAGLDGPLFKMNTSCEQPQAETRTSACDSAGSPPDSADKKAPLPKHWREAKAQGLKAYDPGTICPAGHLSPRRVWNRRCLQCISEAKAKQTKLVSRAVQQRMGTIERRVLRNVLAALKEAEAAQAAEDRQKTVKAEAAARRAAERLAKAQEASEQAGRLREVHGIGGSTTSASSKAPARVPAAAPVPVIDLNPAESLEGDEFDPLDEPAPWD